jgi:hypothetical protein
MTVTATLSLWGGFLLNGDGSVKEKSDAAVAAPGRMLR